MEAFNERASHLPAGSSIVLVDAELFGVVSALQSKHHTFRLKFEAGIPALQQLIKLKITSFGKGYSN